MVVHQQVNVVILAVVLGQFAFKILADRLKHCFQKVQMLRFKDLATVLGHEDQVYVHHVDNVATFTNVHVDQLANIGYKPYNDVIVTE